MKKNASRQAKIEGVENRTTLSPSAIYEQFTLPLAAVCIALSVLLAYSNSFSVPFIFDDRNSILENATIRNLTAFGNVLSPPSPAAVEARPFVNFTLAVNYALGGFSLWGYHAVNLLLHALAGLTLFGVVRRTLLLPSLEKRFNRLQASVLALTIAMLWVLHPLQTESVTYIVQRAEILVSLFNLLTLYCFIRGIESQPGSNPQRAWPVLAFLACLLGMGSKESMASAPLIVLLYDRTFVAGSFRKALTLRYGQYAALTATWILLAWLMIATNHRSGTTGLASGYSRLDYALIECWVIPHYLRLCIWPHVLILDYGRVAPFGVGEAIGYAVLMSALLGSTIFALVRYPAIGFLAAFFFIILAPTSSFEPLADPLYEHRMYLPLAAVLTLLVMGLYLKWGMRSVVFCLFWMLVLGWLTFLRNRDYQSELSIWSDTVTKSPGNARAQNNLGMALADLARIPESIPFFTEALRIQPDYKEAAANLASALVQTGRVAEALPYFEIAQYDKTAKIDVEYNYGLALAMLGRLQEALPHLEAALQNNPNQPIGEFNLGNILFQLGRNEDATRHFEIAVKLAPNYAQAENGWGKALASSGRFQEAREHFAAAIRIKPGYTEAEANLAWLLPKLDHPDQTE